MTWNPLKILYNILNKTKPTKYNVTAVFNFFHMCTAKYALLCELQAVIMWIRIERLCDICGEFGVRRSWDFLVEVCLCVLWERSFFSFIFLNSPFRRGCQLEYVNFLFCCDYVFGINFLLLFWWLWLLFNCTLSSPSKTINSPAFITIRDRHHCCFFKRYMVYGCIVHEFCLAWFSSQTNDRNYHCIHNHQHLSNNVFIFVLSQRNRNLIFTLYARAFRTNGINLLCIQPNIMKSRFINSFWFVHIISSDAKEKKIEFWKALTCTCDVIAGHINAFSRIVECPFEFNVGWIRINATSDLGLLLLCNAINTWLIWAAWWRICSEIKHQISILERFITEKDRIK